MTLAHGTERLESARLVLRRIAPDDLPFCCSDSHCPIRRATMSNAPPAEKPTRMRTGRVG
jgi:hypothetical protein